MQKILLKQDLLLDQQAEVLELSKTQLLVSSTSVNVLEDEQLTNFIATPIEQKHQVIDICKQDC